MAEYKPYLDQLFADADQLMWQLSEKKGYFTNYEFLRRAAQRHQAAYIRLLNAVLSHRSEEAYLFNIAHENIGSTLLTRAQQAGYEPERNSDVKEHNIWGDAAKPVVYRRTERVRQPV
jgi:hypothetical protein